MLTPGPGRTKDTENKLSYLRSKYASRRLHFTFLAKRQKSKQTPILRYLQQLGFIVGHSSMQECCFSLLAHESKLGTAFSRCKHQLLERSPTGHVAKMQAALFQKEMSWLRALLTASLVVSRTVWTVHTYKSPACIQEYVSPVTNTASGGAQNNLQPGY